MLRMPPVANPRLALSAAGKVFCANDYAHWRRLAGHPNAARALADAVRPRESVKDTQPQKPGRVQWLMQTIRTWGLLPAAKEEESSENAEPPPTDHKESSNQSAYAIEYFLEPVDAAGDFGAASSRAAPRSRL